MAASPPPAGEHFDSARLPRAGARAALFAGTANALVYLTAREGLGLDFVLPLPGGPERLPLAAVIASSAAGALGGTLVLFVLARLLARPLRAFRCVAFAFLLVSLGGPLSLAGADPRVKIALDLMHLIAAVLTVQVLGARPRP